MARAGKRSNKGGNNIRDEVMNKNVGAEGNTSRAKFWDKNRNTRKGKTIRYKRKKRLWNKID